MADPTETEVEDQPPAKKDWRKELEGRAENAETKLVEAETRLAFYDAGLGHLTDEQRDDVLTLAKSRGQTGAEDLKSIANRLSYTKPTEPQAGQEAPVEDPAKAAELAELARLAAGSPGPGTPQPGALDLSEFVDNKALKDHLMTLVDESFGPTFE